MRLRFLAAVDTGILDDQVRGLRLQTPGSHEDGCGDPPCRLEKAG
jgi:hypothetical protein